MKKILVDWLRFFLHLLEPKREFAEAEVRMEIGSKAFYAEQMLNNPIYREVIQKIENETMQHWKNARDLDDRERLHVHWMVLRQINDYIKLFVSTNVVKQQREIEASEEQTTL